jgi:hypothetical protein
MDKAASEASFSDRLDLRVGDPKVGSCASFTGRDRSLLWCAGETAPVSDDHDVVARHYLMLARDALTFQIGGYVDR